MSLSLVVPSHWPSRHTHCTHPDRHADGLLLSGGPVGLQVKEVGAAQAVCSIQDTASYSHHTLVSTYRTGRRQAWFGSPALHCVPM